MVGSAGCLPSGREINNKHPHASQRKLSAKQTARGGRWPGQECGREGKLGEVRGHLLGGVLGAQGSGEVWSPQAARSELLVHPAAGFEKPGVAKLALLITRSTDRQHP